MELEAELVVSRIAKVVDNNKQTSAAWQQAPKAWGLAVFFVGLLLSALAAWSVHRGNVKEAEQVTSARAHELIDAAVSRITRYQYGLRAVRGHLLSVGEENISRELFRRYSGTRDIDDEFPGARGFGFIRRVALQDEGKFLRSARADGMPDFTLRQLAAHDKERYVIQYVEPVERNVAAVGLDIGSEASRRAAAEDSLRSGEARLTAPITLVQATGKSQQSFLILMPIYRGWDTPESESERLELGIGWSYAPLITEEILASLPIDPALQLIELIDVTDASAPVSFFSNARERYSGHRLFTQHVKQDIYGRTWQLNYSVTPRFIQELKQISREWFFAWGVVISSLVSLLVWVFFENFLAKQRVHYQQARLAAIVESSSDGIISTLLDGTVTSWNRGAEKLFGYSADEAIGKNLGALIVPPEFVTEDQEIRACLARGDAIEHREVVRCHRNGHASDFSMSAVPLHDERWQISSVSKTLRDISEQKAAELQIKQLNKNLEKQVAERTQQLDQLNRLFISVLNAATEVSIIATDLDGVITVFNKGAERMLGYKSEDVVHLCTPAMIHSMDEMNARSAELTAEFGRPISGFNVFVEVATRDGMELREWTYIRKNGTVLPVNLVVTTMRNTDNQVIGYLGIATDISARKIAELALREQAQHTQTILDNMIDGVITIDYSGHIHSINPAAENLFLYRPDEVIGRNVSMLMPNPHRDAHDQYLRNYQESGKAKIIGIGREVEGLRKDQTLFPMELSVFEINDHGQPMYVGIVRDITLRKQTEKLKSDFVSMISHELRTPMNAILGMLQLVLKTELNARQQDYIVKAQTSAKSLLGLLNDILDFSKIEAGKLEIDPHPCELEGILRELSIVIGGNHGDKDVEVLFELDPALPRVLVADRMRLLQVLTNLASNALKFTDEGHVVVSVSVLGDSKSHIGLRFAVKDTGIGIGAAQQKRIFTGFEQAESSTTRRFGGTGLGLAISKRLVNLMGGDLEVESRLGSGSRFWFDITLPVADATAYISREYHEADIHVLVVDDSPLMAEVLVNTLKQMAFTVSSVSSGMAAVEEVARAEQQGTQYDVVLMDWRMPDVDGLSAAQMIRANAVDATPPVIIMVTAYEREVVARSGSDESVYTDLLTKPVTPLQLAQSIRYCVSGVANNAIGASPWGNVDEALKGIKLLVVEDNELNRQVAEELLACAGAQVDLAHGGLEGVEKTTNNPYDMIIMDIQMPDIDGYEATRRIRLHSHLTSLPILAMTANALDSDIKACHAAGMNGHVSKPIDMEELVEKILRLLGRPVPRDISTSKNMQLIQSGIIDDSDVIFKRFGGNRSLFSRMLTNFRPEVLRLFSALDLGLANQHQNEVTSALHSLKGMAATMGAKALAAMAADLEQKTKQAEDHLLKDSVSPLVLDELSQCFEKSEQLLLALLIESSSGVLIDEQVKQKTSITTSISISDQLEELLQLLESDNMGAIGLMEELAGRISPSATLNLLVAQVNALAFSQAAESLKTLREEIT